MASAREKIHQFDEKATFQKLTEYVGIMEGTFKTFGRIHHYLFMLKNKPNQAQMMNLRGALEREFDSLEEPETQFYINSIGDFWKMHRHLKQRFEAEVLKNLTSKV